MKKLIAFLLSGCWHEWEVTHSGPLSWDNSFFRGEGTRFILQCKKCGEIKKKDLR